MKLLLVICEKKFRVIAVLFLIPEELWAQLWLAPEKTGEEMDWQYCAGE